MESYVNDADWALRRFVWVPCARMLIWFGNTVPMVP